jgi:hypothetical protein
MADDIIDQGLNEDDNIYPELDQGKSPELLSLEQDYRLLFRSEKGVRVLTDILMNMCWFGKNLDTNLRSVGERNVGISILARLGHGLDREESIIRSIVNIPIKGEVI